jgi:hypothetical protein
MPGKGGQPFRYRVGVISVSGAVVPVFLAELRFSYLVAGNVLGVQGHGSRDEFIDQKASQLRRITGFEVLEADPSGVAYRSGEG